MSHERMSKKDSARVSAGLLGSCVRQWESGRLGRDSAAERGMGGGGESLCK